jgi:ubiquinone/menaquinone biosynthesis C-methylase UbiE
MGNYNSMEISDKDIEKVYDEIASDFDKTRYNVWSSVKKFINSLPKNSEGLEIGCGNGKNMIYAESQGLKIRGIDLSNEMIKICKSKNLLVNQANMLSIPLLNRSFDFVLSVASLHHLDSVLKRKEALKEMFRLTKVDGLIFISVWANTNNQKDKMISFYSKKKNQTFHRYYHLYDESELELDIMSLDENFEIIESYFEKDNWVVIVRKLLK